MPGRKRKRTQRQKFSFVLDKACDERTRPQYSYTLKDRFVRHVLAPERTKALVFVFVFVLAHEQAICIIKTSLMTLPIPNTTPGFGMPLWSMTHWTHSSKSSREKFYPRSWEELSKVSTTTTLSKGFCQSPDIFKSWKNTSFEIKGRN